MLSPEKLQTSGFIMEQINHLWKGQKEGDQDSCGTPVLILRDGLKDEPILVICFQ